MRGHTLIQLADAARLTRWADGLVRVPVLLYHMIIRPGLPADPEMAVPQDRFSEQLTCLADAGCACISLDRLIRHVLHGEPVPPRSFAITFDDGFLDTYRLAWPVLQRRGMTATVFLVSDLMDKLSEWMRVEPSGPQLLMGCEHVREMHQAGIGFGSHGRRHVDLTCLDDDELADELCTSRQVISGLLREDVRVLAYPFGRFNARVRSAAARMGYAAALSVRGGWNRRGTDPLALRRIVVSGRDTGTNLLIKIILGEHRIRWHAATARLTRTLLFRA
ncbi:MAG: polysaccharide deacetylase family protein [Phycisphaerae bacterium]|nr:polysaccharide deacetylase family protein [Phycisphaerae bacterium]